jgi:molybdenum cofactor biosynthesis protein B
VSDTPPGAGKLSETLPFRALNIAVMTVSDTRDEESDTSGKLLAERVARDNHVLAARAWVKDSVADIQAQLKQWIADPGIDVVISTGGTGLTGRDVTPEAVRPLFDKSIEGVGLSTIQSRACAGIAGNTMIFALPGSNGACKDGWDKVIRWQLDSRFRPCNLVELMPRFLER